jgi:uncharacterized protein (DUF169 family)
MAEPQAGITGQTSARVTGADVSLQVRVKENGTVKCELTCNGQRAVITFTDTDVNLDISSSR